MSRVASVVAAAVVGVVVVVRFVVDLFAESALERTVRFVFVRFLMDVVVVVAAAVDVDVFVVVVVADVDGVVGSVTMSSSGRRMS